MHESGRQSGRQIHPRGKMEHLTSSTQPPDLRRAIKQMHRRIIIRKKLHNIFTPPRKTTNSTRLHQCTAPWNAQTQHFNAIPVSQNSCVMKQENKLVAY